MLPGRSAQPSRSRRFPRRGTALHHPVVARACCAGPAPRASDGCAGRACYGRAARGKCQRSLAVQLIASPCPFVRVACAAPSRDRRLHAGRLCRRQQRRRRVPQAPSGGTCSNGLRTSPSKSTVLPSPPVFRTRRTYGRCRGGEADQLARRRGLGSTTRAAPGRAEMASPSLGLFLFWGQPAGCDFSGCPRAATAVTLAAVRRCRARACPRASAVLDEYRSATSFDSAPFFPLTVDRAKRAGGRGTRVRLERSIARCRPLASGRPHRRSSGGGIGGMA